MKQKEESIDFLHTNTQQTTKAAYQSVEENMDLLITHVVTIVWLYKKSALSYTKTKINSKWIRALNSNAEPYKYQKKAQVNYFITCKYSKARAKQEIIDK